MADMKSMLKKGLKDMKVESQAKEPTCCPEPVMDEYPYGLRIDLGKDALKKLGLSVGQFTVGEQVCLECKADVISIRSSKGRYDSSENVELQITHLGFETEE